MTPTDSVTWHVIADFPIYEVSNTGLVRSNHGSKRQIGPYLRTWPAGSEGYAMVCLYLGDGSRPAKRYVHEIVCTTFHGKRPSRFHHAAHDDGNKHNNSEGNLLWKTPAENTADQKRHGTFPVGSKRRSAKTSEAKVKEIDRRLRLNQSLTQISAAIGVNRQIITQIRDGYSWRWLTGRPPCAHAVAARARARIPGASAPVTAADM